MERSVTKIDNSQHKEPINSPPNILPYIIVFAILILTTLGVLTWVLGEWYQSRQCFTDPNIWCFDTWQCETNCTTVNDPPIDLQGQKCFQNALGATGLASCVFGVNSFIASYCFVQSGPSGPSDPLCSCVLSSVTGNCFANCASTVGQVPTGSTCCCCPGTTGCQWTAPGGGNAYPDSGGPCGPLATVQKYCPNV
jgi:hypothetical protein